MLLSDVTLREGDQMPGRAFSAEEKIECGHALDSMGVPFVQPGFPATGEKDQRVVEELAATTDAAVIALARALEQDIDLAVDAGADVVETFVSASDRHLEHLLGTSREGMLSMLGEALDYIHDHGRTAHVTLAPDVIDREPAFLAVADAACEVASGDLRVYHYTLATDAQLDWIERAAAGAGR